MSQSETCIRKLRAMPLQNIIATSGASFICVGYNHPKERAVPQDRFCHCWKNASIDQHSHWDRRDLLDTVAMMSSALSVDENIRIGEKMTEAQMNKADLTAPPPAEDDWQDIDPAAAAIGFALQTEAPMEFLRLWNEGSFDDIRREWPDAPDDVFIGADPLFQPAANNAGGKA
ncbi:MAG: hypothetical protein KKD30_02280 [Gammaproteobacteria bacterium]|uniref:Uncharacterized protein n=1 Tax=viral metagenome TaxID=1070528 RepID=A0A6M3M7R0_9ZZZZ|nr:hypothetical protein [Gammaproteobacteria bacterium]MBU0883270.1 hypothetical protein [Gammaproteobacteria bacterium]MBU1858777.1 hypothetical protein [Gammaproteobacteria bacterium]